MVRYALIYISGQNIGIVLLKLYDNYYTISKRDMVNYIIGSTVVYNM